MLRILLALLVLAPLGCGSKKNDDDSGGGGSRPRPTERATKAEPTLAEKLVGTWEQCDISYDAQRRAGGPLYVTLRSDGTAEYGQLLNEGGKAAGGAGKYTVAGDTVVFTGDIERNFLSPFRGSATVSFKDTTLIVRRGKDQAWFSRVDDDPR